MEYAYQLNCGQYVLHQDGKPIGPLLDEVAMCISVDDGTRHKHGSPDSVRKWHAAAQKKFRDAGFDSMADDLVVIQGRFPLDELDKCLNITGYAGRFYGRIKDGTAPALNMLGELELPSLPQA